ncbi:ferredoxin [Streptomyces sp. NPDC047002]|uniref:ferredoxin n=1 Tax=Streptomyces sp. NPDC047002 TaxID=3155475 RepID=UPI0034570031
MRITVEQDRCVASGQCVLAAPELFDQRDEDGIVVPLRDEASPGQEEAAREAARICPALAITLDER